MNQARVLIKRHDESELRAAPTVRRQRRHVRRWLVVAGLVATVWAAVAAMTGVSAQEELQEARAAVRGVEEALADQDLERARVELAGAATHARNAATDLRRPYMVPLRLVPLLGPNLRSATALADAVESTAESAGALADGLVPLTGSAVEMGDREVSLAHVHQLAAPLHDLSEALTTSTIAVAAVDSRWLIRPLAEARSSFLELATPLAASVGTAAEITEVLPTFLGAEAPKRYLLGAASLSELRASGGLMGSWTVLHADDSRLAFDDFADIDELKSLEDDVAAPSEEYAERYRSVGSLREWRNANLTPDFPSSAQVMLEMWEGQGRPALDGVILVDSVVFARLVEGSDALEIPDVGTVEADDILRFVALDAYAAFEDDAERKRALGAVATSSFTRLFDLLDTEDLPRLLSLGPSLVEGGHVRVYTRDDDVQSVFADVGIDGALIATEGEMAGVFVNNVAGNKVDWFTRRSIEHHVRLLPEGLTEATVSVGFDNRAPREGYPRHVLGPWTPHTEAGDNLSLVNIVCGRGCEHLPVSDDATDGGTEMGHPVADLRVLVPAGQRRTVTHRTQTTGGWHVDDGDIVVPVVHLLQPTLHQSALRVRLTPPPGWVPAESPSGAEFADGDLVWDTVGSGREELTFRLARVPSSSGEASGRPSRSAYELFGRQGSETVHDDERD
jgi:hypothetical protein